MCQRYSMARLSSAPRMPGKLRRGKPSMAITRRCLAPIFGAMPPTRSCDADNIV